MKPVSSCPESFSNSETLVTFAHFKIRADDVQQKRCQLIALVSGEIWADLAATIEQLVASTACLHVQFLSSVRIAISARDDGR